MQHQDSISLLDRLLKTGRESEWLEFKESNKNPELIGERISALSNSAALHHEQFGYIIFGVEDGTLKVVGTTFKPSSEKVGNEPIEGWLLHRLNLRLISDYLNLNTMKSL